MRRLTLLAQVLLALAILFSGAAYLLLPFPQAEAIYMVSAVFIAMAVACFIL